MSKTKLAIFASGTGSNAVNLIRFFKDHESIEIVFVLSNNPQARVLSSAEELGVESICMTNSEVADGVALLDLCNKHEIDWIILAGYLRLIPTELINSFENRMINLHPSLLPKYGGKGMYGRNVHTAVLENKETESGITVHYVSEEFDKGAIIAQFHCEISPEDEVLDLERKIRHLEQSYLPTVIQHTILA